MKQQFLLAQCVSSALATNQIAHYINWPIESAVAHLGVLKPDLQSLITAHMVYFCAFACSQIFKKCEGIRGGSWAISSRRQRVKWGKNIWIAVSIFCFVLGRGTVFLPEDTSSDGEDEDQADSICRGLGISVGADPRNIKFEVFSTRIHEGKRKQCVVSLFSKWMQISIAGYVLGVTTNMKVNHNI